MIALGIRSLGFFVFWLLLSAPDLTAQDLSQWSETVTDLLVGTAAAVLAAWASLRLYQPSARRPRPVALVRLVLRFLGQSVVSGFDMAWRALAPRLPLRPGVVRYETRLQDEGGRSAFMTMTSMVPGTLPLGEAGEDILYHCLDVQRPVREGLMADEALFIRATGRDRSVPLGRQAPT